MIGQEVQQILTTPGSTYVRVHPCNIQLKNNDKMICNDSPSSDKNMGEEILKGETNKHDTELNQESIISYYYYDYFRLIMNFWKS